MMTIYANELHPVYVVKIKPHTKTRIIVRLDKNPDHGWTIWFDEKLSKFTFPEDYTYKWQTKSYDYDNRSWIERMKSTERRSSIQTHRNIKVCKSAKSIDIDSVTKENSIAVIACVMGAIIETNALTQKHDDYFNDWKREMAQCIPPELKLRK